jgi:branched-chain amino acid transport system ATP-binding protein
MSDALLEVSGLRKRFAGLVATDGVDLTVRPGELHAVIGPNGAGKTTLINQLSGELLPDAGTIRLQGQDITRATPDRRALAGVGRSFQISSVFADLTVEQNVMLAVQAGQGHSYRFWQRTDTDASLRVPALRALQEVGLAGEAGLRVAALAHGGRRQLELAMTLAMSPKLLLLDEPMAGMSPHESARVVELLRSLKGRYGILLVEHDMQAVFSLADRITVLVYGRPIACGTPEEIRGDANVRAAYLGEEQVSSNVEEVV